VCALEKWCPSDIDTWGSTFKIDLKFKELTFPMLYNDVLC